MATKAFQLRQLSSPDEKFQPLTKFFFSKMFSCLFLLPKKNFKVATTQPVFFPAVFFPPFFSRRFFPPKKVEKERKSKLDEIRRRQKLGKNDGRIFGFFFWRFLK
jgi:hypothetical protein